MTMSGIDSIRKYSFEISLNEAIDQLNEQLRHLVDNTQIHLSKKRKLLLQFERRNNQFRRSIDRLDLETQKKLTDNISIIRLIKKKIIDEDRQQRQRRRDAHGQNNNWPLGVAIAGIISIATFILMMFYNSKENYMS